MIRHAKGFKLICNMPTWQEMCESSKNRIDPKEDTEKASSNLGIATFKIKRGMSND